MCRLTTFVVLLAIGNCSVYCFKLEPFQHVEDVSVVSLQKDLRDFMSIVPVDDIHNLTEFFYANDSDMRKSYDYLRGDEGLPRIWRSLSALTLVKKFASFLNESGVNVAELGKRIEKIVLTREEAEVLVVSEQSDDMGGMNAFFTEALSLIPQEEVLTLFFSKMEQSSAFSSFLENLNASDYENLTESLKKNHGLQDIYFELLSHGIDIMEWAKSLRSFLGY